jgi:BNR/Asp-box repeat
MRKYCFFGILIFLVVSCKTNSIATKPFFTKVKIDTLLMDKISIRAIESCDSVIWYSGSNNRIGMINLEDKLKTEIKIDNNPFNFEFRSIAKTKEAIFIVNISSPAVIHKFSRNLRFQEQIYQDNNEKIFYDSMKFWNDKEGTAIGDPIADCLNVIITRNGGKTWSKIPCENLPKTVDGEAAFAASNTNVIVKDDATWIVSGGKKSRVFFSKNKGISWEVFETPIVQGEAMTGIFTADFYNSKIGFIAGGNYEKPNQNFQNKAITFDGGKTWKLVGENQGFGYASCVQFVPKSDGKQLVCVGTSGLFYSSDFGENWQQLSDDKSLYTIRFIDWKTAIAAGKDKIIRLKFN